MLSLVLDLLLFFMESVSQLVSLTHYFTPPVVISAKLLYFFLFYIYLIVIHTSVIVTVVDMGMFQERSGHHEFVLM
jgi:hypothetical protein